MQQLQKGPLRLCHSLLAFFNKFPAISKKFTEGLVLGRLTFSDQRSESAEQLLQMTSSHQAPVVKAESVHAVRAHDAQELDVKNGSCP